MLEALGSILGTAKKQNKIRTNKTVIKELDLITLKDFFLVQLSMSFKHQISTSLCSFRSSEEGQAGFRGLDHT
jgi:hypothetical protein